MKTLLTLCFLALLVACSDNSYVPRRVYNTTNGVYTVESINSIFKQGDTIVLDTDERDSRGYAIKRKFIVADSIPTLTGAEKVPEFYDGNGNEIPVYAVKIL